MTVSLTLKWQPMLLVLLPAFDMSIACQRSVTDNLRLAIFHSNLLRVKFYLYAGQYEDDLKASKQCIRKSADDLK